MSNQMYPILEPFNSDYLATLLLIICTMRRSVTVWTSCSLSTVVLEEGSPPIVDVFDPTSYRTILFDQRGVEK